MARGGLQQASQSSIERILHEEGIVIDHAGDATEAVRRFASDEHDLIILTHGEGGRDLLAGTRAIQTLRARTALEGRRFVPVLMMSSSSEYDALREGRDLGVDDVLPIGLPPQQAAARVRAYLALSAKGNQRISGPPRPTPSPWRHELTQRLVHDLRNPLAGLSSNLAYMDDRLGQGGDPEVLEALADCRAAVGRLRRAATMLVDLGRLEEGNLQPRRLLTQVVPMLQDLLGQRLHEATLRDLKLCADVPPGLSGSFDHEIVARTLHALLDHALRYAQAGTTVMIAAAARKDGGLNLRIQAAGEWLPKLERSYLAHGNHALPSVAEVGLGLHYAQLAAIAHGGSLEVHDDLPGALQQTVVVISL